MFPQLAKVVMVENYDEEVFIGCMREIWRDSAQKSNETRCKISDGNGGFITCCGDCKNF